MKTSYTKEEVIERLQQCNIKPSIQRIEILKYLLEHPVHPSIDDIYNKLFPKIPTLSKTTVYNTLSLLETNGAILSINIDDKMTHYDGDTSEHAHFLCTNCREIFDVPLKNEVPVNTIEEGFYVKEAQIYYKGLCPKCRKNQKELNNL